MKTFTINSENEVMALDSRVDAEQNTAPSAARFSSIDELAQVTRDWPLARLVGVWNGLPGLTPVSKFTDRRTAITRIWKALQDPVESTNASHAASPKPHGSRRAHEGGGPRGQQEGADTQPAKAIEGSHASRSHECDRLAGPFGSGLHQRASGQEDGAQGELHPAIGWSTVVSHHPRLRLGLDTPAGSASFVARPFFSHPSNPNDGVRQHQLG